MSDGPAPQVRSDLSEADFVSTLNMLQRDGRLALQYASVSESQTQKLLASVLELRQNLTVTATDCDFHGFFDWPPQIALGPDSSFAGTSFSKGCSFAKTQFQGTVHFEGTSFEGDARFDKANFTGSAGFVGSKFLARASFDAAHFPQGVDFQDTRFDGLVSFASTYFDVSVSFWRVVFGAPDATPEGGSGADFRGAVFDTDPAFEEVEVNGRANYSNATFKSGADFLHADLRGGALFYEARFEGTTDFEDITAGASLEFEGAQFLGPVVFDECDIDSASFPGVDFAEHVSFSMATVKNRLSFERAQFNANPSADFEVSTFLGPTSFERAQFKGNVTFFGSHFKNTVDFSVVRFGADANFRTNELGTEADFRESRFVERVHFSSARSITGTDARFDRGFRIGANDGAVALQNAQIGGPSLIEPEKLEADAGPPSIADLRKTNVESLAVAGVNLSDCKFENAHRLSDLAIEGASEFSSSPRFFQWPPALSTRRKVIAEERAWWVRKGKGKWRLSDEGPSQKGIGRGRDIGEANRSAALNVAASYRALRRGLESRRETELAGDFYYGEMQMRRKGSEGFWLRSLLAAYWALSGYGTRAFRSLAWLVVVVTAFMAMFNQLNVVRGNTVGLSLSDAFWLSLGSAINFFKPPPDSFNLNPTGEHLTIVLHLLSVLLVALFVLALRARVKR